jgi:glycosyltransferase involved in cell wall biosynthesis
MYAEKRLPFLLGACRRVRELVPDFELVLVGGGEAEGIARAAAHAETWVHVVGPKFEHEKIPFFLISRALLMPGLVGLVVLDSFALEVPLITTSVPGHGPEIEYLEDGVNSVIVTPADDPNRYAEAVARVVTDARYREGLQAGCRAARERYSAEDMAHRFARGVAAALSR